MKKNLIQLAFSMAFLVVSSHTVHAQWIQTNGPFGGFINVLVASGSSIFAGTSGGGIFLSTNNGTTWIEVDTGLPIDTRVSSLAVSGSNIFAGTYVSGLWRRPLSEMGVINHEPKQGISKQAGLRLNSPNHATTNLTIEFFIPQSDQVTMRVYNLSGHEITSLVNSNLEKGLHHVSWDIRSISASFSILRMQAGSNCFVKNIPVIRSLSVLKPPRRE